MEGWCGLAKPTARQVDGDLFDRRAANVSSMKVDNLDGFSRASAKSDTTSGIR
jgi:hypothetical protein